MGSESVNSKKMNISREVIKNQGLNKQEETKYKISKTENKKRNPGLDKT
jgi:hypothetical protein